MKFHDVDIFLFILLLVLDSFTQEFLKKLVDSKSRDVSMSQIINKSFLFFSTALTLSLLVTSII